MHSLVELVDYAKDLPAVSALFMICLGALAVAWKALDVVGKSRRDKPPKKKP